MVSINAESLIPVIGESAKRFHLRRSGTALNSICWRLALAVALVPAVPASATPPLETEPSPTPVRPGFWVDAPARQGGVLIGRAPSNAVSVSFGGRLVPVTAEGFFLIAFDRDAPSDVRLGAVIAGGRTVTQVLTVIPGKWRLEHVNADYRGGTSSADFTRRRPAELAQINAARRIAVISEGWRQDFIWPLKGRMSGVFGSQRVYRGKPGSYHSGTDIAALTGTEYVAPADGVVTLAAGAPFTLEGWLLIIDHGMGLSSAFLHSSALLVKTGDVVKQGQPIGTVGATGRATGPHLHWGMKWHGARIDPAQIVASR